MARGLTRAAFPETDEMRILVIGAGGAVGRAVVAELAQRHDVLEAGRTRGAHRVDVRDLDDVQRLFAAIDALDAVVVATGSVHFGPLGEMTAQQFRSGIDDKLMGQINVVLAGQHRLADGGSFTLTSGILAEQPIRDGADASTVNAALEGFVRAAAIELPRGLRINAVSPTVLAESMAAYGPYFRGFEPAPASRVALAYARSVEGAQTGQVYKVW